MDIRIEKTKTALHNTFLELRSRKPLEKITIKELCEKAQINKSTFYSHYKDIYDLSDQLETEVVTSVIEAIPNPANCLEDPAVLAKNLFLGYLSRDSIIRILFSGTRAGELVRKVEYQLKKTCLKLTRSTNRIHPSMSCCLTRFMAVIMHFSKTDNTEMLPWLISSARFPPGQ